MSVRVLNEFRTILSGIASVNDAEWDYIVSHLTVLKLKKDVIFHKAGSKAEHMFFLVNGTVRKFSQQGEKKITHNIYSNQRFLTDLLSVCEQKPSNFSFECLSDTTVVKLTIEFSEKVFSMSPTFATIARIMYQQGFMQESLRLQEVLISTPTEQYLHFARENKELSQQLTQAKIAECLNMAPETLSRIKKKLLK